MPAEVRAETMNAPAWPPAGTTVFVPLSRQVPACCSGARLDVREPVARVPLLVGEDDELLALGDALEPERRGRRAAGAEQVRRDQRDGGEGLEDEAAAELFHHHHRVDRAEAHAALRLGHGETGEAEPGEALPRLAREAACPDDRAAALEVVVLLDPLAHGVAQHFLVVGEIEVHLFVL
jgi:hypothetical protein